VQTRAKLRWRNGLNAAHRAGFTLVSVATSRRYGNARAIPS
ncbi:MAG: hypothetical protein JWN67_1368, partial [Actinomycetia bacterium]|nr:hypothetical protein [Actinomycetes bacterium]